MDFLTNIIIAAILIISTEGVMQITPFSEVLTDKEKRKKLLFRKCTIVISCAYVIFGIYLYMTLKEQALKEQIKAASSVAIIMGNFSICLFYVLLATTKEGGFDKLKKVLESGILRGLILGLTRGALLGIVLTAYFDDFIWISATTVIGMYLGLMWGWVNESKK